MKTKQNKIDEETVRKGLGTGADQRGGQDKLDPPRRNSDGGPKPDQPMPNHRFNGIRIMDNGPDSWGIKKVLRYEE
jgi:hypothetical protein